MPAFLAKIMEIRKQNQYKRNKWKTPKRENKHLSKGSPFSAEVKTLVFEEVNCFDYIFIEMNLVTLSLKALN